MRYLTQFLTSAAEARQFPPPALPEIAFLGRSNVGKSSLINKLLGEKVAKTSSTPGRTRTINFFSVRRPGTPRPEVVFADLPGYGYAKLPKDVTAEWPKFIEPYLRDRPNLALCLVLVDTNVPPQNKDGELIEWLRSMGRHFVVVGTKSDRVSGNTLRNSSNAICREFQLDRLLPFSAKTGEGADALWQEIRAASQRPWRQEGAVS
jgi:GTP-binding protein